MTLWLVCLPPRSTSGSVRASCASSLSCLRTTANGLKLSSPRRPEPTSRLALAADASMGDWFVNETNALSVTGKVSKSCLLSHYTEAAKVLLEKDDACPIVVGGISHQPQYSAPPSASHLCHSFDRHSFQTSQACLPSSFFLRCVAC